MKSKTTARILMALCIAGFFANALSFLLMPVDSLTLLPGILFWAGLVVGIVPQFFAAACRRKDPRRRRQALPGVLTFFSTAPAIVADGVMIMGFLATVVTLLATHGYGYICFVMIAVTVLGISMHCVLNGKVFRWAAAPGKVSGTPEEKQARKKEKEREGNA